MSRSPQILLLVWLGFVESFIEKLPAWRVVFKSHAFMFLFTARMTELLTGLSENVCLHLIPPHTLLRIDQTLNLFFAIAIKSFPMVLLDFFLYN